MEVGNEPLDLEYFDNIVYLVEQVLAGNWKEKSIIMGLSWPVC